MWLPVLLLASARSCHGWAVYAGGSTSNPDFGNLSTAMQSSFRWSMRRPLIRWALTPDFCSAMQPLLIENGILSFAVKEAWQNFTTCERIHSIVREAFDTWSQSNPALHFVDVTGRCESERLWRPIADDRCAESDYCLQLENATEVGEFYVDWKQESTPIELMPSPASWLCSQRTCFECDRADVMVGGFTQKNRRLGDQHAKARVQRTVVTDQPPLAPHGGPADGKTVFRAWLEFNVDDVYKNTESDKNSLGNSTTDNCYRLDNDICDWVVSLPDESLSPDSLHGQLVLYFWCSFAALLCLCLCIVISLLQRLAANLLTGWDVDRDGKLDLQEIVYVLDEFCGEVCFECRCPSVHQRKMSPLAGCLSILETISQTSVIVPVSIIGILSGLGLLYADGVMSCFACRDLRAIAIHEIGHLLSLDHSTGAAGTVPLVRAPPPPPPILENETMPYLSLNEPSACTDPYYGVTLDPALPALISPPPAPPSPLAPPYAPNMTDFVVTNATHVASSDGGFEGKMGALTDLNSSVMIAFGTIGLELPSAGSPRRCIDRDDLDGINFLYPTCGSELHVPSCEYETGTEYQLAGLRLVEAFLKLMLIPFFFFYGLKFLSIVLLLLEDFVADFRVRREAHRMLREAEAAEARRLAGDSDASPTHRKRLEQIKSWASSGKDKLGAVGSSTKAVLVKGASSAAAAVRHREAAAS